mmetsp:Transcript_20761/g.45203  ORF Transcript_20761/g.45203 Transcript_20761/m.45203 type:complete len:94 (+) Transcript_20761:223-504(+)
MNFYPYPLFCEEISDSEKNVFQKSPCFVVAHVECANSDGNRLYEIKPPRRSTRRRNETRVTRSVLRDPRPKHQNHALLLCLLVVGRNDPKIKK